MVVIFQNFINEHNLWGTTAVLALSVHATVENNNLEFLLFSLSFFPPIHPHFQFLTFFKFFLMSFFSLLFFPGNQQQLEVKVLDFCYSTDNSINKPLIWPPLSCSNNMYTNKLHCTNKKMLHCYIIITCSKRTRLVAVRTPHSTQFFRLVQRGGCKTSWEVLFTELCTVCLFHALQGGKFTQRRPTSTQNIPQVSEKKQLKNKKIINRLFLTI